jgi:hypothetical protein
MLAQTAAIAFAVTVIASFVQAASAAPPGLRSGPNAGSMFARHRVPHFNAPRFNGPHSGAARVNVPRVDIPRSNVRRFHPDVTPRQLRAPQRYHGGPRQAGTSTRFQDVFAQLCGSCRQRCVSGAGMIACWRRPFNAAACTAAINACLAGCQRRYCRRSAAERRPGPRSDGNRAPIFPRPRPP